MFDAISIPFGSKMLFNTVKLKPGLARRHPRDNRVMAGNYAFELDELGVEGAVVLAQRLLGPHHPLVRQVHPRTPQRRH